MDNKPLEISRLHSDEVNSLFAMFAALQEFNAAKETMQRRLRSIPGGTRDIAMLHSVLGKLIDKVIETIPVEKRVSLARNMKHMSYKVYLVTPINSTGKNEIIVDEEVLRTLIDVSHYWQCGACDNDCNKCALGKALDKAMIQCRGRNESWSEIDMHEEYTDEKAREKL